MPVERIKAIWKAEKLNRDVQLTISGCLGPCDLPNVAVVMTGQEMHWYGHLNSDAHYDAFIAWARACVLESRVLPLPQSLDAFRLDRFANSALVSDERKTPVVPTRSDSGSSDERPPS